MSPTITRNHGKSPGKSASRNASAGPGRRSRNTTSTESPTRRAPSIGQAGKASSGAPSPVKAAGGLSSKVTPTKGTPTQAVAAKQRRELRRIGHMLQPVVIVGDEGLSRGVLGETDRALADHELIKVRLPAGAAEVRRALGEALCAATGAALVQNVGRVALIFRPAETPDPRKSNLHRHPTE